MTPELGLIEGFFGRPWSWRDREEAVRFFAPAGFAFYLYAAKADPFLRRRWQEPHPDAEAASLAALAIACRTSGMRFGIGLSPFELHLAETEDWHGPLADRLAILDEVARPDDLAILFDDMRGDIPDLAERQAAIVHFAASRTKASRILCCPSYYSDDKVLDRAFGRRPAGYLEELGRRLDGAVEILWTGEEVVSRELRPGHLDRVADRLGRRPFLWDNYPVNDGPIMSRRLHLRAFTGRPAEIGPRVSGHGINLASQPWLSRIPALTLVDSYRLGPDYEYMAAFDRAARLVLGDALAERVGRDLISFQDRGLDALGERRADLRAVYAEFDHPAADEIIAWLDEYWAIEGETLATQ